MCLRRSIDFKIVQWIFALSSPRPQNGAGLGMELHFWFGQCCKKTKGVRIWSLHLEAHLNWKVFRMALSHYPNQINFGPLHDQAKSLYAKLTSWNRSLGVPSAVLDCVGSTVGLILMLILPWNLCFAWLHCSLLGGDIFLSSWKGIELWTFLYDAWVQPFHCWEYLQLNSYNQNRPLCLNKNI